MKLRAIISEWSKSALPPELRKLYRVYWYLREIALRVSPGMDPYICNIITPQIFKYLKGMGIPVQMHTGSLNTGAEMHMWAVVKLPAGKFIVDGSEYQTDYGRPITNIIPGRLGRWLRDQGITNLFQILGVIDTKLMGKSQALDDGAYDWDDAEVYQKVAEQLTDDEVELIKGRLLPIMLHITPIDEPSRVLARRKPESTADQYKGSKYNPEDGGELNPQWEKDSWEDADLEQDEF